MNSRLKSFEWWIKIYFRYYVEKKISSKIIQMIFRVTLFKMNFFFNNRIFESRSHHDQFRDLIENVSFWKMKKIRQFRKILNQFFHKFDKHSKNICILIFFKNKNRILQNQLCFFYFEHVMYNATNKKIVEKCIERAINLLQFIVSIYEMKKENRIKQFTNICKKFVVCISSMTLSKFQIFYDLNASKLKSM